MAHEAVRNEEDCRLHALRLKFVDGLEPDDVSTVVPPHERRIWSTFISRPSVLLLLQSTGTFWSLCVNPKIRCGTWEVQELLCGQIIHR